LEHGADGHDDEADRFRHQPFDGRVPNQRPEPDDLTLDILTEPTA
jgi:hypothetical protein